MTKDFKDYKNLTGILLGPVRERPGMYLSAPKISLLQTFIMAYSIGSYMASTEERVMDNYFEENGFISWFFQTSNIKPTSCWETPFLDEANQDEQKALELFFKYLEEFQNSMIGK